jgi:hypothetical protein
MRQPGSHRTVIALNLDQDQDGMSLFISTARDCLSLSIDDARHFPLGRRDSYAVSISIDTQQPALYIL